MKVEIIKCLKDNYSYVIIDEKYKFLFVYVKMYIWNLFLKSLFKRIKGVYNEIKIVVKKITAGIEWYE